MPDRGAGRRSSGCAASIRTCRSGPPRSTSSSTTTPTSCPASATPATAPTARTKSGLVQVPTRSGARSLRSQAMTESAVIRPVFGFSDGMFSIDMENRAESDSTSTRWMLRVSADRPRSPAWSGRAMPASDSATATLRLAGNPFAASRAVPSNIFSGSVIVRCRSCFRPEGRAREALNRFARHHPDRMDFTDCRGRHRVEADQRAGRHHDLAAILFGEIDQVLVLEQRACAEHDRRFALLQTAPRSTEELGRRAFDDDVGDIGSPSIGRTAGAIFSLPSQLRCFSGFCADTAASKSPSMPGPAPRRFPSRSAQPAIATRRVFAEFFVKSAMG